MRVCDNVHQIKIDFNVTPDIRRFVYVYLITGRYCYLIDSGVKGAELAIDGYMRSIGRELSELRGLFLTHSHPDHIGAAKRLKELTGCTVYAGAEERGLIENVDRQFAERPIPNFYGLVGGPVIVDKIIANGDKVSPEESVTLSVIDTPGHSAGSQSYVYEESGVAFIGDALPVKGDIPIYVDPARSLRTLDNISSLRSEYYCPAWDRVYTETELQYKIGAARALISSIGGCVREIRASKPDISDGALVQETCRRLGMTHFLANPLFCTTVLSHRN